MPWRPCAETWRTGKCLLISLTPTKGTVYLQSTNRLPGRELKILLLLRVSVFFQISTRDLLICAQDFTSWKSVLNKAFPPGIEFKTDKEEKVGSDAKVLKRAFELKIRPVEQFRVSKSLV
ncbi:unnamed protein product [Kuraishia capsulata CBS 1993]|uniref:Uncharacterized protein n=1 Tax=Kuraishia capsulata CBS 1993 TaxID=1382522 RepID=W6MT92_9ASCO|nr:uncharacterized protein KUCA_T00005606001 [Kuraishia capsulata CBS 1993]CDK29613.1 unnamed protein product [Kuraishia capsulata CBS 1993]